MLIALIFRGGYNTVQNSFMLESTHYQLFGDYCYKLQIPFTKDDAALAYNIMVIADGQYTKCKHLKCITKDALCDIADKSNFDYIDTADLIQKLTNKKSLYPKVVTSSVIPGLAALLRIPTIWYT